MGLENIKVIDCTFSNNGSTQGPGVIGIDFQIALQNVVLENNTFEANSAHLGSGIVLIQNSREALDSS